MLLLLYFGMLLLPVLLLLYYATVRWSPGFRAPAKIVVFSALGAIPFAVIFGVAYYFVHNYYFPDPDAPEFDLGSILLAIWVVVPLSCWVFCGLVWLIASRTARDAYGSAAKNSF